MNAKQRRRLTRKFKPAIQTRRAAARLTGKRDADLLILGPDSISAYGEFLNACYVSRRSVVHDRSSEAATRAR